jgi:hypothetical protein
MWHFFCPVSRELFYSFSKNKIMADDLKEKRPQDASRISTSEEWEINYWTKTLGCTRQQLLDAVKAVGNSADAVRKHLGK